MLVRFKSSSAVLVTGSSKFIFVCNRFHAKLVALITEIAHFEGVPIFESPCTKNFLNLEGQNV